MPTENLKSGQEIRINGANTGHETLWLKTKRKL